MNYAFFIKSVSGFLNRNRLFLLFLLLYLAFITYFFRGISTIDPDFGWRLKVGEIIKHYGIPQTDPFSYTMPSFPFVDHAWFFSLLIFLTYPIFSNGLLSLLLTFLVFTCLLLATSRLLDEDFQHADFKASYERLLHPMLLVVLTFLLLFFSVRAQIISWFIFAVLNLLLFKKDNYVRYRYFLPLIFFFWANLHGGYSIGLAELAYFILFRFIFGKKGGWRDFLILLFSILATLITPYGLGGWREVVSSVIDSRLRWSIAEWMPSVTFFDISMAFYIAMSVFMVFLKRKEVPKIQFVFFWLMLFMGITSRRNMPFFMIYSLPLTIYSINRFYLGVSGINDSREKFRVAFNFIRVVSVILLLTQMYITYWRAYSSNNMTLKKNDFYPSQAVSYLKSKSINGEVFSSYGWGGYLIWKYPEKKVFIDGRMPSWKFTPTNSDKESPSVYDDYLAINNGELDFNAVSEKYNIQYVLWPKEKDSFSKNLERKIRNIKIFKKDGSDFSFTGYLKNNGWRIIYEDQTSEIYTHINTERI